MPHRRRNIAKSPAAESAIQERITDRQQLAGAASPPGVSGTIFVKTLGSAAEVLRDALPALVPWTIIFSLIFGGCCSNVGSSCRKMFLPGIE